MSTEELIDLEARVIDLRARANAVAKWARLATAPHTPKLEGTMYDCAGTLKIHVDGLQRDLGKLSDCLDRAMIGE